MSITITLLTTMAIPSAGPVWILSGILLVFILMAAFVAAFAARRYLNGHSGPARDSGAADHPRSDNPAAFMAASMQAVIQKLRDQEKELERLHRADRDRAQQTERLSEAVTRNMPAGLVLLNAAGLLTSANPAAESALGIRLLPHRRYQEVLGTESKLTRLLTSCLQEGRTFRREEVEYLTPLHELRQLGVTISPVLSSGEVTGAICLLSDLTELAALQKQIHLKENLAALGELSAGIAHEFKNALATISGYAQMIRSEASRGTEIREHSEKILDQTVALTRVVTEFLKFARPLTLVSEQVALQPLIERVLAELREAMPDVTISTEGEFGEVSGDDALLRQAILNLVRNGAEAAAECPGDGRVVIRGEIETSGPAPGQRISIADSGPGILHESLPKLFVPFYTTKPQGTGLGLAVVHKIIVQHGGTITARNQAHGGAEFTVWLPFVREPARIIDRTVPAHLN